MWFGFAFREIDVLDDFWENFEDLRIGSKFRTKIRLRLLLQVVEENKDSSLCDGFRWKFFWSEKLLEGEEIFWVVVDSSVFLFIGKISIKFLLYK